MEQLISPDLVFLGMPLTLLPLRKKLSASGYILFPVRKRVHTHLLSMCLSFLSSAVLDHMDKVASTVAEKGLNFKLKEGFSAETSGTAF